MMDQDARGRLPTMLAGLGPIGQYSSRPGLLAAGLGAAVFGFLPGFWPLRALIVLGATLGAEMLARMSDGVGANDGDLSPPVRRDPPVIIDRLVGAWWALLPLRRDPLLLVVALGFYWVLVSRQVGLVGWAARVTGGRRGVADDTVAGLVAGLLVAGVDRLIG